MQAIRETLVHIDTIAIEKKELTPIAIVPDKEVDSVLEEYSMLYPASWKPWHAKWIKSHSSAEYRRLASTAKQEGNNPARYFSWLLKNYA